MNRLMVALGIGLGLAALSVTAGCSGGLPPGVTEDGFAINVPEYDVPAGEDWQTCHFIKVPEGVTAPVWINRFELNAPPNIHHVDIFRVTDTSTQLYRPAGQSVISKDASEKGSCFDISQTANWPLVANQQQVSHNLNWLLPDGVAAKFMPGEELMVQIHVQNVGLSGSLKGGLSGKFHRMNGEPKNELGTIFGTTRNVHVCADENSKGLKVFSNTCKGSSLAGVTVTAANGHFHSRGKRFDINLVGADGTFQPQFYETKLYTEAEMKHDIEGTVVPDGGTIGWSCAYQATSDDCQAGQADCCFNYGPDPTIQEHCNAFIYYYPKKPDFNCDDSSPSDPTFDSSGG